MSSSPDEQPCLDAVPLFPLPNVVLLPRAILPLHIFEERYKQMTADVLAGDKQIAMALLEPGWEKNYYQRPVISPVVCAGKIVSFERLSDGKYNFLLQGTARARVVEELPDVTGRRLYRVARLQALCESAAMEIDLEEHRRRLSRAFSTGPLAGLSLSRHFRELSAGPICTADLADIAAFTFIEDVPFKQHLLEETDAAARVGAVVAALEAMSEQFNPALHGYPAEPGEN